MVLLQLPWTTLPMDVWRHAAVALHRVWVVAVTPSRRLLTALSRRLIPSTLLPPSTRGMALQGGTQSSGGVRVDAAPEVVASVRSPPGLAMVVVALLRSPGQARKMQRRSLPLLPFLWRPLPTTIIKLYPFTWRVLRLFTTVHLTRRMRSL